MIVSFAALALILVALSTSSNLSIIKSNNIVSNSDMSVIYVESNF
jgi:hypothetical protein